MKPTFEQLSIFDIVMEHDKQPIIEPKRISKKDTERVTSNNNRCPYKIPTVDEIIKHIDKAAYKVSKSKLISDVFECGAIAISNQIDYTKYDERENRYKQIMNQYKPDEQNLLAEVFGMIFTLLSSVVYDNGTFGDYLGELFMRLNQGSKNAGQFFTPYHISKLLAKMVITDDKVKTNEIMTLYEPCCGSGSMVIASMDVLQNDYRVNYTRDCFVMCEDIDIRCVHMAYLQLSLAGVPAIIQHADTLTRDVWDVWKTPAFILQFSRFEKYL